MPIGRPAVPTNRHPLRQAKLPEILASVGLSSAALTSVLSGGFAGITAMAALFPLETVRTRMATGAAPMGVGLLGFSRSILQKEGVRGLYRGLPPSLLSVRLYLSPLSLPTSDSRCHPHPILWLLLIVRTLRWPAT